MNTFIIIIIIIVIVVVVVDVDTVIMINNNSNCNIVINILILPSTISLTLQFNKNKIPRTKMIAFSCVLFLPVLCHKFYLECIVSMKPKDLLRLNGFNLCLKAHDEKSCPRNKHSNGLLLVK